MTGPAEPSVIRCAGVSRRFGGLQALSNVDFSVPRNSITALIGPNGAGKTTIFNLISGLDRPDSGNIDVGGRSIAGVPAHAIVSSFRLVRTFQNVRLYSKLTVADNVRIGRHARSSSGFFRSALKVPSMRREERDIRAQAMHWLEFVGMAQSRGSTCEHTVLWRATVGRNCTGSRYRAKLPAAGRTRRRTE